MEINWHKIIRQTDKLNRNQTTCQKCDRNVTFDIAKGIGIVLIVLSHCMNLITPTKQFICLFHVTLFFVISGYFFKAKYYMHFDSAKEFILKKIKTLYLPYIIVNSAAILLNNVLLKIHLLTNEINLQGTLGYNNFYTSAKIIKKLFLCLLMWDCEITVAPIWFLRSLFWISICFCIGSLILNKFFKNSKIFNLSRFLFVFLCLFFGFYFYKINFNFYQIGTMLSCSIAFYIGFLYKKYENVFNINYITLIISFITLIFCNYLNPKIFFIGINYYNNPFWLILTTISGFIFILSISKMISKFSLLHKFLNYIGLNTLVILCLHFISFRFVNIIQILYFNYQENILSVYPAYNPNNSIWWFAYLLAGVFIPCIMKELYIRLKVSLEFKWK